MKKVLIYFIVFTFNSSLVFSQTHKIDSLYSVLKTEKEDTNKVYTLNALSWKLRTISSYNTADSITNIELQLAERLNDKAGQAEAYNNMGLVYADKADYIDALKEYALELKICDEAGNKWGLLNSYNNIGLVNYNQGDYTNALKNFDASLQISQQVGNNKGIANSYNNMGMVYSDQSNYPNALNNFFKALKTREDIGDKQGVAGSYNNIAIVYKDQGDYGNALKNHFASLKISEEIGDKKGIALSYNNIGDVYSQQGDSALAKGNINMAITDKYPNALKNFLTSYKLYENIGDKAGMALASDNIGDAYSRRSDYPNALKYHFASLQISLQIGDKNDEAYSYNGIGFVYTHQKKYSEAKDYLDKGLVLAKEMDAKDIMQDNYNFKSTLDSATGNYKDAYEDYKSYIIYHDSLKNEENTKKIVSEQMQYDFDKKQAEDKAQQDKKDAVSIADKHKQQIVTGAVSLGLLLVVIFSGLLFSRFRITQKQKLVIEQQKKLVDEKNKEVLDSIIYAKRLQDAILPPLSVIKKHLPESFVLYKPKDIVAGDFYWMERLPLLTGEGRGEVVLIAACDCTGHGVPGAMVSVVCSNALNRAVKEFKITEPGKILDKVRELVLETFEKSESDVQDGMDISLASITPVQGRRGAEIQWAGAYNPLWYIPSPKGEGQGEVIELAPNKQPIGKTDNPKPFTTHMLNLQKGDTLYLFTDGYADQFGGPKGKKFKYKTLQEKLLAISSLSMDKQKEELDKTLESWKSNLEQVDDILIIGIRV